jgi:hypothetical protein
VNNDDAMWPEERKGKIFPLPLRQDGDGKVKVGGKIKLWINFFFKKKERKDETYVKTNAQTNVNVCLNSI